MWVLRQAGLPISRSATTPWLTYKLCFCKKTFLFETSLMKGNFHTSILEDRSHFCNWFSNLGIRIDWNYGYLVIDQNLLIDSKVESKIFLINYRLFSQLNLSNYVTASYIIWLNNVDQKTVIISKQIKIIYHEKLITKI